MLDADLNLPAGSLAGAQSMPPKKWQRRYVTYYRVSTERQGRSGLGLEAQQRAVADFLQQTGGTELATFREVESGKVNERPQLDAALRRCRQTRATLLVAKLDRLSRNAAFLLSLRDAGVRFVACDLPDMNETVVGILAVIAEAERKAISSRTAAALSAAKARGVRLGNPRLQPGTAARALIASKAGSAAAEKRAEELREVIEDARARGCATLLEFAEHLNSLEIPTARGGRWIPTSVRRLLMLLDRKAEAVRPTGPARHK